ncbi:AlkA N-terminal domain-containing protein [Actinoallomurus purpureus]|uniref:AlkA N-terminal domain-containing protein n=1 Tax=Actinoallomurus purpureus TaxID=478114 RepID=UPI0027E3A5B4|nr:AlkA N-terminal domain-containing protein [Actinoallomurus purpureus]
MIDEEDAYALLRSRDRRFDGRIFVAVVTTGIYCRPSCPAVMPKRENTRFFPSPATAQQAGFRACRRCRPDAAPGSPEWNVRADLVGRAMRLITDGLVDREGVSGLAARLGYSERQLHRQLVAEVGAGPQALARAQRAQAARILLERTDLPVSDVAFAAGFASIRQFNHTVRQAYGTTPTGLRAVRNARAATPAPGAIDLRLAYRPPLDLAALFGFLAERAVAGIEDADDGLYRRSLDLPRGSGVVALRDAGDGLHVHCELRLEDLRDLSAAVSRCRRLLDLDTDPWEVADVLGEDPLLAPLIGAAPGRRVPGHANAAELAVRAVFERYAGVMAARELAAGLVRRLGRPLIAPVGAVTHVFPGPAAIAGAEPAGLGLPDSIHRVLMALTDRLATEAIVLDPGADREETERGLRTVPGIDAWTAGYIRIRALGDPDVLLPADPGVRRALDLLGAPVAGAEEDARRWRPWRSYAVQHLWSVAAATVREPTGSLRR